MSSSNKGFKGIAAAAPKFAALLLAVVCAVAFAGCAPAQPVPQPENTSENAPSNNQYMADLNSSVEELGERLQSFNDAVSRSDAVGMRIQADNASAILDQMAALEAPEELTDLRSEYVKGCDSLKNALNAYVTLYTEIATASEAAPFDYSTYSDRLQEIQTQYDEGIQTLEDADKKATEL